MTTTVERATRCRVCRDETTVKGRLNAAYGTP
jgi:hypothetical protein